MEENNENVEEIVNDETVETTGESVDDTETQAAEPEVQATNEDELEALKIRWKV